MRAAHRKPSATLSTEIPQSRFEIAGPTAVCKLSYCALYHPTIHYCALRSPACYTVRDTAGEPAASRRLCNRPSRPAGPPSDDPALLPPRGVRINEAPVYQLPEGMNSGLLVCLSPPVCRDPRERRRCVFVGRALDASINRPPQGLGES